MLAKSAFPLLVGSLAILSVAIFGWVVGPSRSGPVLARPTATAEAPIRQKERDLAETLQNVSKVRVLTGECCRCHIAHRKVLIEETDRSAIRKLIEAISFREPDESFVSIMPGYNVCIHFYRFRFPLGLE